MLRSSLYVSCSTYYEAGLSDLAWDQMRNDYAANLTEAQRFAAYAAGQNDAAASLVQEKLAVSSAKTAGTNSSLVYDDFVRKAVERGRNDSGPAYLTQETVEQVNSVAKPWASSAVCRPGGRREGQRGDHGKRGADRAPPSRCSP